MAQQYGALAGMGTDEGDHLKFSRTQIGLLDALLATQPEASCDELFQQAREKLLQFSGVEPGEAPPGFVGTLRPYQRDGLGWMDSCAISALAAASQMTWVWEKPCRCSPC